MYKTTPVYQRRNTHDSRCGVTTDLLQRLVASSLVAATLGGARQMIGQQRGHLTRQPRVLQAVLHRTFNVTAALQVDRRTLMASRTQRPHSSRAKPASIVRT